MVYLNKRQAARFSGLSEYTLRNMRQGQCADKGPSWVYGNQGGIKVVLYPKADLEMWLQERATSKANYMESRRRPLEKRISHLRSILKQVANQTQDAHTLTLIDTALDLDARRAA